MTEFLPGTEVLARGIRWQVVFSQNLGAQTTERLRGLQDVLLGQEFGLFFTFEPFEPITQQLRAEDACPLRNGSVYHQAFLIEQASGANVLLSVQPGRLRLEPYKLVPVLRAIRMSRVRLLLAEPLSRQRDTLLLLTATPHDGHDCSFASLCELLDHSLVNGKGELRGTRYTNHVIRRLKRHVLDPNNPLQSIFRERIVRPIRVQVDEAKAAPYARLQRTLLTLIAPELRRAFNARCYSDVLTYITMLKRSVSSVLACRNTLTQIAEWIQTLVNCQAESQKSKRQRLRTLRDYQRKLDRFGVIGFEEEAEFEQLDVEELAQQLAELQREVQRGSGSLKQSTNILATLNELVILASDALEQDPTLPRLVELTNEIRQQMTKVTNSFKTKELFSIL